MIGTNTRPVPTTPPAGEWELPEEGLEITLPSGATFEHEIHDGHERRHGWEQVKELPGIDSVDDVGEVVRAPNAIEEDGQYDLIIGDNPNGDGQVVLRLLDGMIVSASQPISDYDGERVEIEDAVNKIVNEKDDWDHNQLGNSKSEVRETLKQILQDPGEVYKATRDSDGATISVYLKEMYLNGNEVVVFALVRDGQLITSFVPAGEAPPGSAYENVYDRSAAIEYIKEEVLKTATGQTAIEKVEEFKEIIEEIDIGETYG